MHHSVAQLYAPCVQLAAIPMHLAHINVNLHHLVHTSTVQVGRHQYCVQLVHTTKSTMQQHVYLVQLVHTVVALAAHHVC
jgi:hypothetical protein